MVKSAKYTNTEKTLVEVIIEHIKFGEIPYGIDLNNVDTELAEQIVEELHTIPIEDYVAPIKTDKEIAQENNAQILSQIDTLEKELIRPMRELLSTKTDETTKIYAQNKVDDIEAQIEVLRNEIQPIPTT